MQKLTGKTVSLLACFVLVAAIIGVVITLAKQPKTETHAAFVNTVPAGVLTYQGITFAGAMTQLLAPWQDAALTAADSDWANPDNSKSADSPAKRFALGVLRAYADTVKQSQPIPGLAQPPRVSMYAVGTDRVARIPLADAAAFNAFLDQAEQLGEVTATPDTYQGVALRSYATSATLPDGQPVQLTVAVLPQAAVMTVTGADRDQLLPVALGLKAPAQALSDNADLQALMVEQGLRYDQLLFINQQAMTARLTTPDVATKGGGHSLSALLQDAFPELATPACQTDLMQLAKAWPYTVLGMQAADNADEGSIALQGKLISRLTDSPLTHNLEQLRGHIPAHLLDAGSPTASISLALGLNMDEAAPVLMALQQRFVEADFQCPLLQRAQQRLTQTEPASAAMVATTALAGVQGISLSIFDEGTSSNSFSDMDAMLVVSTQQPRRVFTLLKKPFRHILVDGVQLPDDGTAVTAFKSIPGLIPARVMVSGPHLVFFRGKQAALAAQHLQADELDNNGVFYSHVDYQQLLSLLDRFAPNYTRDRDVLSAISWLHQQSDDAQPIFNTRLDVDSQGLTLAWDGTITPLVDTSVTSLAEPHPELSPSASKSAAAPDVSASGQIHYGCAIAHDIANKIPPAADDNTYSSLKPVLLRIRALANLFLEDDLDGPDDKLAEASTILATSMSARDALGTIRGMGLVNMFCAKHYGEPSTMLAVNGPARQRYACRLARHVRDDRDQSQPLGVQKLSSDWYDLLATSYLLQSVPDVDEPLLQAAMEMKWALVAPQESRLTSTLDDVIRTCGQRTEPDQ